MSDFRKDLPVANIRIGKANEMRIYGFNAADMGVPLVQVRCGALFYGDLHLTVEQADAIATGLSLAVAKARGIAIKDGLK